MASKGLTMKAKKQTATAGVVGVVLLLAKFFPRVYGMVIQQTGKVANADPQRSSEIINGIILISFGLVWSMVSRMFSYAPFFRSAWMVSGYALVVFGVLLVINQNPFRNLGDDFDLTGYQA